MTDAKTNAPKKTISAKSFAVFGGLLPAIMVGLDQMSKWAITRFFDQPLNVCEISNPSFTYDFSPIMDLSLICNRGISWGLMQGDSSIKRWGLTIFAFVMVILLLGILRQTHDRLGRLALSFFVGGAIGNAIDRLFFGAVTDMIDFSDIGFNYVFNIADSFITIGVMMLLFSMFLEWRAEKANAN